MFERGEVLCREQTGDIERIIPLSVHSFSLTSAEQTPAITKFQYYNYQLRHWGKTSKILSLHRLFPNFTPFLMLVERRPHLTRTLDRFDIRHIDLSLT